MKRFIFTVVLALVAVAAALPYWFGVEAERIFYEQLENIESRGDIEITDSSFQRGWLRSESTTKVLLKEPGLRLDAYHTLEHGPFPASNPLKYLISLRPLQALVRSRLRVPSQLDGEEDLELGRLTTTVNIDGSTSTAVDTPAVSLRLNGRGSLAWQMTSGTVDFLPTEGIWRGELHLGGMDWSNGGATLGLGPSVFTFESYSGNTGLAMGNSTLVSDTLYARVPGSAGTIDARGVVLTSTAEQQGQSATYTLSSRFESATVSDLTLDQGQWNLSASDLDVDALTRLNAMDVGSAIPLNELVLLVTKRKAKLRSTLQTATGSGPLNANAHLSIAGDSNSTNPFLLIGALEGEAIIEMPLEVVELAARSSVSMESGVNPQHVPKAVAEAKTQSWVDKNILTRLDDRYRFQASVNKGSIKVNDKPVNLLSLLTR